MGGDKKQVSGWRSRKQLQGRAKSVVEAGEDASWLFWDERFKGKKERKGGEFPGEWDPPKFGRSQGAESPTILSCDLLLWLAGGLEKDSNSVKK